MELKLINSKEVERSRYFSTKIEENYQINPLLSVRVDGYVALHQSYHSNLYNFEIQDWETTYFVGGEECKNDGFKEIVNKLFTDLTYESIEKEIKEKALDATKLTRLFPEFNFIQSLSPSEAAELLETMLPKIKTTVNDDVEFIFNWELKEVAKIAGDPRVQKISCLSDYDLEVIGRGSTVAPRVREVFVISKNLG
jgi:hypothetical protein